MKNSNNNNMTNQTNKENQTNDSIAVQRGAIGVGGMVAGVGLATLLTPTVSKAESGSESNEPKTTTEAINTDAAFDNTDYSNTSFSDAFAQARKANGPGAYFKHEGGLYNTYYTEEWNDMTEQQKLSFKDSLVSDENFGQHYDKNFVYGKVVTPKSVPTTTKTQKEIDTNGDGIADVIMKDIDGDGDLEIYKVDLNHDGNWDIEHGTELMNAKGTVSGQSPKESDAHITIDVKVKVEKGDNSEETKLQNSQNESDMGLTNGENNDASKKNVVKNEDVIVEPKEELQPMQGTMDTNMDGHVDAIGIDTDRDNYADIITIDTDYNGVIDTYMFNEDNDPAIDVAAFDILEDGLDGNDIFEEVDREVPMDSFENLEEMPADIFNSEIYEASNDSEFSLADVTPEII